MPRKSLFNLAPSETQSKEKKAKKELQNSLDLEVTTFQAIREGA